MLPAAWGNMQILVLFTYLLVGHFVFYDACDTGRKPRRARARRRRDAERGMLPACPRWLRCTDNACPSTLPIPTATPTPYLPRPPFPTPTPPHAAPRGGRAAQHALGTTRSTLPPRAAHMRHRVTRTYAAAPPPGCALLRAPAPLPVRCNTRAAHYLPPHIGHFILHTSIITTRWQLRETSSRPSRAAWAWRRRHDSTTGEQRLTNELGDVTRQRGGAWPLHTET